MTDIRQAFDDGLVDTLFIDLKWVRDTLARGKEAVLRELRQDKKRRFIEDTIEDIGWWACFHDHPVALPLTAQEGIHSVSQKARVGRNDPCPCGSGKKYKKCCGR